MRRAAWLDGGAVQAALNVVRTDAAGDAIDLDFTRSADGDMSGDFVLDGAVGGTVATLMRAPEGADVTGRGTISGTVETGTGEAIIQFGDAEAVQADLGWTPQSADLDAQIMTTDWPVFDAARGVLGQRLNVSAELDRTQAIQPFTATVGAENFEADLSGVLGEDGGRPDALRFDVRSTRLGAVLPLPDGYSLGDGRAQGDLNLGQAISGRATVDIANVVTPYGRAAKLSGPISLSPDGQAFRFDTTMTATRPVTTQDLPLDLGQTLVLTAKGRADTNARRVSELDASLVSGPTRITAKGSAAFDASTMNLSGTARANLKAVGSVPPGRVDTTYALRKTATSDLAISAAGDFAAQSGFAPPLDDLLGRTINYDVKMLPVQGGLRITEGRVNAEGLRAAFAGRVAETLDVSAELSLLRPVANTAPSP